MVDDTTSQIVSESFARMPIPTESSGSSLQTITQTTVPTTVSAVAYAGPSSSVIESSNILSDDPEPSLSSSQSAVYTGIVSQTVSSSFSGEKSMKPSSSAQMSVLDSASGSVNQAATSASDYSLTAAAPVSASSITMSSSKAESSESEANISGMVNVTAITSAPAVTGSQVMTFDPVTSSSSPSSFDEWSESSTNAYTATSSINEGYTPTQTWLIVASTASSSYQATSAYTSQVASQSGSGSSSTTASPSIASIPSSMPTLIVPGNSVANNANAGTGGDDDPIKGDTLIAILLAEEQYPWWFVVSTMHVEVDFADFSRSRLLMQPASCSTLSLPSLAMPWRLTVSSLS